MGSLILDILLCIVRGAAIGNENNNLRYIPNNSRYIQEVI